MSEAAAAYLQLVFTTSAERAENLYDALMELGAVAVDASDALAGTPNEEPQYGEPDMAPKAWTVSRIKALFPPEMDARAALAKACRRLDIDLPESRVEAVPEEDWVRVTESQFSPIHVSPNLWIVPSWCEPPADGAGWLVLDPGLAFGTGSHPTTRLCLQWIDANLRQGATVLDYGCGSGILALAAHRFGAAAVLGIDIDEHAVSGSRNNAAANRCQARFESTDADPGGCFDLVVANILSNPLMLMAPMLCARVAPGGDLVLSGVLERQADDVIAAYRPWIGLDVWRSDEGWVCLHGRAIDRTGH